MRLEPTGGSGPSPRGITPDHLIRLRKIDAVDANCRLFIRYGFCALIAFFGYRAINVLSGQYTFADIAVRFVANIKVGAAISHTVGGGGVIYGFLQKKLRGDAIKKMASHIKELEERRDPNRGSSGLTERGGTRPEDEL
jgi:hypothetical protein